MQQKNPKGILLVYLFTKFQVQQKNPKGILLVHLTRLELAHPKALPPQGSVYTNFTTGAYIYYSTDFGKNPLFVLWCAVFDFFNNAPVAYVYEAI